MSWKYPSRRKSDPYSDGANDTFNPFSFGFKTGFQDIDQLIKSMFRAASSFEGNMQNANTVYYGYQVTMGPDGKPQVREFGNVRPTNRGTFELGSREPFVESLLDDKENVMKIVAEMPGVRKEGIQLEVTEGNLIIKAQNGCRTYDTCVPLDTEVDVTSTRASYNNGILEVRFELKSMPKPKGFSVKVE